MIGVSLGLLGGGGSTLAVPILVYIAGMPAKPAIAASLVVVGTTSLAGSFHHWRASNVDGRTAVMFGAVSMISSYGAGRFAARVPDAVQLVVFALVMLVAATSMIRSGGDEEAIGVVQYPLVLAAAVAVGALTGIVGVGGGFLIVPALVLFAGVPMKRAVGTSLIVIAMNCAAAFYAYAGTVQIAWLYTAVFTLMALVGVSIGAAVVPHVSAGALRRAFAVFLIAIATIILVQTLVLNGAPRAAAHDPQPVVSVREERT